MPSCLETFPEQLGWTGGRYIALFALVRFGAHDMVWQLHGRSGGSCLFGFWLFSRLGRGMQVVCSCLLALGPLAGLGLMPGLLGKNQVRFRVPDQFEGAGCSLRF